MVMAHPAYRQSTLESHAWQFGWCDIGNRLDDLHSLRPHIKLLQCTKRPVIVRLTFERVGKPASVKSKQNGGVASLSLSQSTGAFRPVCIAKQKPHSD
jgi:hypothetical protein